MWLQGRQPQREETGACCEPVPKATFKVFKSSFQLKKRERQKIVFKHTVQANWLG